MFNKILIALLTLSTGIFVHFPSWADGIIPFATQESLDRLARSHHNAFLGLVGHYKPQDNRFFCGITTAVIVLNALRTSPTSDIIRPLDMTKYDPSHPDQFSPLLPHSSEKPFQPVYEKYTESSFFTDATNRIITKDEVYGFPSQIPGKKTTLGVTISELHQMFLAHNAKSIFHIVDRDSNPLDIIEEMKRALSQENVYVIVNYYRPTLGQVGRGHFSPLGAYDELSDSFLLLDISPYIHHWVWVPAQKMAEALLPSIDPATSIEYKRGYMIIEEGNPPRRSI